MASTVPSAADLPTIVPVFPLSGALLFPRTVLPLNIFEPRYLAMVDHVLGTDRIIGIIQPAIAADQAQTSESADTASRVAEIGTLGRLTHFQEIDEARYVIALTGLTRFRTVEETTSMTPYRQFRIDISEFTGDLVSGRGERDVDRDAFIATLRNYADFADLDLDWDDVEKMPLEDLVNSCVMASPYGPRERQALLETSTLRDRAEMLTALAEIEMKKDSSASPLQ
jgi:Lon protease-like protein